MPLITLQDAKDELNIAASNTTFDTEVQLYVDATTDLIERYTGPWEPRSVTETARGGRAIALSQIPVISIQSFTDPRGLITTAVADTFVNTRTGIIRPMRSVAFADPVTVVYTAGRLGSVPASIQLAARMVAAHLWETQRGTAGESAGAGDDYTDDRQLAPGYGFALPNRALALLARYRQPSGVA